MRRLYNIMILAGGFVASALAFPFQASCANILLNFEGDSGTVATDKLASDGAQNGQALGNVTVNSTFVVPFGTQSAFFDIPASPTPVPPYSTLEIPDSTLPADFSLTLAGHFRSDEIPQDNVTRLFSSFLGAGATTTDTLLLDFDSRPNAPSVKGLRAIVNKKVIQTTIAPEGLGDPGYHHVAMTVDQGMVRLYFNGAEVASGDVGLGYSNARNIAIGEDISGASNPDEQFKGNFDDIVMLQRALTPAQIGQLASGVPALTVVTPTAAERSVYYDFEGDSGQSIADKFTADGTQNGIANLLVAVDENPAHAKVGTRSASIQDPRVNDASVFSQINLGKVGNLGDQFTLSAVINPLSGGHSLSVRSRLFSTYAGTTPGRLIFDFDATESTANPNLKIRLLLPDGTVVSTSTQPVLNQTQTLTATYDKGAVRIYLDGVEVASGTANTSGDVDLGAFDLRVGEDLAGVANENFIGAMDDVLVLGRALTAEQVQQLHAIGADALLPTLPPDFAEADFNEDDFVDATDLATWKSGFGSVSATKSNGDADGDSDVDGADFLRWQRQFAPGTPAPTATVPEPGACLLALVAWGAIGWRRLRRLA